MQWIQLDLPEMLAMLILTRKVLQEILISHSGEQLRMVVDRVSASGVRIGFEGPESFEILRDDAKRQDRRSPSRRQTKPAK
jgi:sRNA-binding carbon storage regulator CsrA